MSAKFHATTILTVEKDGHIAMGGDGQVTLGSAVMKSDAMKIRKLLDGKVLVGFAGSSCLLYTSPSPRDKRQSRMPSSA